jgi:hypothetical protein
MDDMMSDLARFTDLVDRYGPFFETWPDAEEAAYARRTVLADPAARRARDEAQRLEQLLASHMAELDARFDAGTATARVMAGVTARLPRRVAEVRWWVPRIAAGFMMAVLAGGVFDRYVLEGDATDTVEIAAVDVLVFGPAELDLP